MNLDEVIKTPKGPRERNVASAYRERFSDPHEGNLYVRYQELTSLAGCPKTVTGTFDCQINYLTSLIGGPSHVNKSYNAAHNKLVSLVGGPRFVGGNFSVLENPTLLSLTNVHKHLGTIKGMFLCEKKTNMLGLILIPGVTAFEFPREMELQNIFNTHLNDRDVYALQQALLDAGYIEQARL